jgi:ATP-dependent DNA helicase RecQ
VLLKICEVCSLIPEQTPVMALIATATQSLSLKLTDIIGIVNPDSIVFPPCKPNITYRVVSYTLIKDNFMPLLEELKSERINLRRTIIYFRKIENCANLYIFFQSGLSKDFTQPPSSPSLPKLTLVDMFTSVTDINVKNHNISLFS